MAQRVSFEERCRIEALGREGSWSVAEIAVHVGRSRADYPAGVPPLRRPRFLRGRVRAGGRGPVKAMRPRTPKLVADPGLAAEVTELLEWRWSPHAIGAYPR